MSNQPRTHQRKRLVLVGGGHAHLRLISSIPELIARGIAVTVLDGRSELFYSGMMPAVLGGMVATDAARIPIGEIVSRHGGQFVQESVTHIDHSRRVVATESSEFPWDVASIAVGSRVVAPVPVAPEAVVFGAKPVFRLPELSSKTVEMLDASRNGVVRVVFIGGGASAVELSGNLLGGIRRVRPDLAERLALTIVSRGSSLVPGMPAAVQQISRDSLSKRGIRVELERTPQAVTAFSVELDDGEKLSADITVLCTGLSSPAMIASSGLRHGADDSLLVRDTLRSAEAPIYGGGDCITIEGQHLQRIGVHAVRQGMILQHNVFRELAGDAPTTLQRYEPPESPLLILNLGDGTGILTKGDRHFHGTLPYRVKERIDWAFVRSNGTRTRPSLTAPPRPYRTS